MNAKETIIKWNKIVGGDNPDMISYQLISLVDYIINEAKREVFDDIEKNYFDFGFPNEEANKEFHVVIKSLKKRHLSTFTKEEQHNNDFKKVCQCKRVLNIEVPDGDNMVCLHCGKPISKS